MLCMVTEDLWQDLRRGVPSRARRARSARRLRMEKDLALSASLRIRWVSSGQISPFTAIISTDTSDVHHLLLSIGARLALAQWRPSSQAPPRRDRRKPSEGVSAPARRVSSQRKRPASASASASASAARGKSVEAGAAGAPRAARAASELPGARDASSSASAASSDEATATAVAAGATADAPLAVHSEVDAAEAAHRARERQRERERRAAELLRQQQDEVRHA